MTEKVLSYDHSITPQETYYDCGPAATQIVLNGRGIIESEQVLIGKLGTTTDGTADVDRIFPVLNEYLGGNYRSAHIPSDPPSSADKAALWSCIKGSIDAGFGLVLNIDVPASNYPRGIKGSESPAYGGGEVFHYIAAMGYDDDPNQLAVWIADSGFRPYGYWVSLDQLATMIPPKGYVFYTGGPQPIPQGDNTMADTFFADVSEFQSNYDGSYPHPWVSIRTNDGTYQDHKFAVNYARVRADLDSGKLRGAIIYAYWRPNWEDTANTMIDMINANGGLHPKVALMIDVESGGNPGGDQSDGINKMYWKLAQFAGNNPLRVFGYANSGDFFGMWQNRPAGLRVVGAGYGSNPNLPGQIAHQYTDGTYGASQGLPLGAPPFGNCDMNVADGLNPDQLAQGLGIAASTPPPNVINQFADASPWIGKRITQGENTTPDGTGRWVEFENAHVYWTPTTGAHGIPKNIFDKWATQKWETGPLGYPANNVANLPDGNCMAFQGGAIYQRNGKAASIVHGAIGNHWINAGLEKGPMGWPTSDEYPYDNQGSVAQNFEHGTLVWNPNNIIAIQLPSGATTNVPDITTK